MSALSDVRAPLFLFKIFPAVEKTLSKGTLVAGICRYLMATAAVYGKENC